MGTKEQDDFKIGEAVSILQERIKYHGNLIEYYSDVLNFVAVHVSPLEHEVFGAILLDPFGHYLAHEILFRGTLLHTTIYPREIVKFALQHNASKIIFYHNHPGGSLSPSPFDIELTLKMKEVFKVMDIELLDHIIAAGGKTYSFKQEGGYLK